MAADLQKKRYDYIIWDWNGTLYDDVDISIRAINDVLRQEGLPLLTLDRYYDIFGFPIIDYYLRLGFDFQKTSFKILADAFISNYKKEQSKAKLQNGAESVLARIKEKKLGQVILSASHMPMLLDRLEHFKITHLFDTVLALDNHFAKSKVEIAVDWKNTLPEGTSLLLIGDTEHDIEAARAINADIVLFSKGHGKNERLSSTGYPVIDSLFDIFKFIQ